MKKNGKKSLLLVLLLLCLITIGYAALGTQLTITGTSGISTDSTWDVHFNEPEVTANVNNVENINPVVNTEKTEVTFGGTLLKPGDVIEFTVEVVNEGGITAKVAADPVAVITSTLTDEAEKAAAETALRSALVVTVVEEDATELEADETLAANTGSTTLTFKVAFKEGITNEEFNAVAGKGFSVNYAVDYVQA